MTNLREEPSRGISEENPRAEPPRGTIVHPTPAQELAVLRAVIYASLFDYPLTLPQLHATLVGERADPDTVEAWCRQSALLRAAVDHVDGLYFPAGRADLLHTRARREVVSRDLLARNRRVLALVSRMPFVRMVALSGSLAHLNAEGSADLDLFVITAPRRVWSVTVAVLVLARLLGWRRRLCLNYVISERALGIEPADLFAANQIIHLKPITGRDVFRAFVAANPFVAALYPNFAIGDALAEFDDRPSEVGGRHAGALRSAIERVLSATVAPACERLARWLYRAHLHRRATAWASRDQVRLEPECLKLHTTSHRAHTLARFDAAVVEAVGRASSDRRAS